MYEVKKRKQAFINNVSASLSLTIQIELLILYFNVNLSLMFRIEIREYFHYHEIAPISLLNELILLAIFQLFLFFEDISYNYIHLLLKDNSPYVSEVAIYRLSIH